MRYLYLKKQNQWYKSKHFTQNINLKLLLLTISTYWNITVGLIFSWARGNMVSSFREQTYLCCVNFLLLLLLPGSSFPSKGSVSYVQAANTHHWSATVSMETTASVPSWEGANSEWTWDDSHKLFPNLVIFHFHATMDIGLQVCRELRGEVFMVWHFTGVQMCCEMRHRLLIKWGL